ncbi:fused MFS/spermidine synthase [Gemmatimonadota bacterium]
MQRTRWFMPAVWGAFFISGVAGLVYEVVWARYLDLVLGGTAYAHIMVLAAYMGGLALGAWVFGRLADRFRETLVIYTYLEMAIGVYGLLFPLLFAAGSALFLFLEPLLGSTGLTGNLNRFLVSILLLGPSTFLMGGTLPLLARAVSHFPRQTGTSVAGLYFINSTGAVFGALLAGFVLIPALGMSATLITAAAFNIIVGIGLLTAWRFGWLISSPVDESESDDSVAVADEAETVEVVEQVEKDGYVEEAEQKDPESEVAREFLGIEPVILDQWSKVVVWGAGISGFLVMVYEVAWIRMLSTILGSSTYSFTLMLAAFISGIALGSLIARRLSRYERPFLFFGVSQLLIGVTLLFMLPLYAELPFTFMKVQSVIARSEAGYPFHELLKYLFCLAIMLPPTLASGAVLPFATDVASRLSHQIGRPVGRVFAMNTLGTILGALLGGLLLLPWLGIRLTLEVGIGINIAFGLWVLSLNPNIPRRTLHAVYAGGAVLLLGLLVLPAWNLSAYASGVFRDRTQSGEVRQQYLNSIQNLDILFYEEDVNGTVAVLGQGEFTTLVVNGKADASNHLLDQLTQTMIAAIPAMLVPDATRALIVGLGSGQTAGHLLRYPVEEVEVVEISPGVVEASRFFEEINGEPLADDRVDLIMQDAKTYLLTRPDKRYDLILSEPSNPWIAGIGGLFTLEYFLTLKDRLEPGGVVAQWIHVYEISDETLNSVLVTFSEAFPYVSLWGMSTTDLLLVGSTQPIEWDIDAASAAFDIPGVSSDLQRVAVNDLFGLLSHQIMSPVRLAEFVVLGGRLNLDEFPWLEYQAPKAFFLNEQAVLFLGFDERHRAMRNSDLMLTTYLDGRDPTPRELEGMERYIRRVDGMFPGLGPSAAAAWLEAEPGEEDARAAALRNGVIGQLAMIEEAGALYRNRPDDPSTVQRYADLLLDTYGRLHSVLWDAPDIAAILRSLLPGAAILLDEQYLYYMYRLAQVEYDQGENEMAEEILNQVLEALNDPSRLQDSRVVRDNVLTNLGRVMLHSEQYAGARLAFQEAYLINRQNRVAAFYLIELDSARTSGRFIPISALIREGSDGGSR